MLKKLNLLVLSLAMGSQALFGLTHPGYEQCKSWGVGVEYLYWLPSIGSTDYVTVSSSSVDVIGTTKNNSIGFQSGFRLEGAYGCENGDELHLRYAWLRGNHSTSVVNLTPPNFLWQLQGEFGQAVGGGAYVGTANSKVSILFENVELLYSKKILNDIFCSDVYLFGGLHFAYSHLKRNYNYTYIVPTSFDHISLSNKNNAIGPEFGAEFDIPLNQYLGWCGCEGLNISFVGQVAGSLLAQKERVSYFDEDDRSFPVPFQDIHSDEWRVIPCWNARAGLAYQGECFCMGYKLELGYEFITYTNAIKTYSLKSGGSGFFDIYYYDLGFQGLYVALGLDF